jgi:hypothetical protein
VGQFELVAMRVVDLATSLRPGSTIRSGRYAIMRALGADPEASFSKLVRKLPSKVEI